MLAINLNKIATIRLRVTCQRFLGISEEQMTVSLDDFIKYFQAAYEHKVRNAGNETAAEAAFIICYVLAGDRQNKRQLIDSCYEMLAHPLHESACWTDDEGYFYTMAKGAAKTFERWTGVSLD